MRAACGALLAVAATLMVPARADPAMTQDAGAAGAAGSGASAVRSASVAFAAFAPTTITVLAGDTIIWRNDSPRPHTVTAEDGEFDSGRLPPGGAFSRRFATAGVQPFYCRLHSFMRGKVDVRRVLLDAPREPTAPGRPFVLTGRTALSQGAGARLQADAGDGFRDVGDVAVAADGTLRTTITPAVSASYRIVSGDDASPPVTLLVLDRTVAATAITHGRHGTVLARVRPAGPAATLVLQLRLREHFGWWPVARVRAGRDGRARFRIPVRRRVPARVVLTLPDGATRLAVSRTLHVGRRG